MAMSNQRLSGTSNQVTSIKNFFKFTVFAATGSIVSITGDGTNYVAIGTIPAAGFMTFQDVGISLKVNAAYTLNGQANNDF